MPDEGATKEAQPAEPAKDRDRRVADLTDDLKRLQADFENFKKRTEKELAERSKIGIQRLVMDMLCVLDSFDNALGDMEDDDCKNGPRSGLERLQRQLLQTLQREGLKEIRTDGMFDPFVHEALAKEERDDVQEGKILEVYQKGYTLGSKILRPARVKVAKKREEQDRRPMASRCDDQPDNQNSER